ncbi:MAG: hypothetical protein ACT4QE_19950 [Anaerolineales bacterium]
MGTKSKLPTSSTQKREHERLQNMIEYLLKMPERYVYLNFFIDTNRINARQSQQHMNKLEEWYRNDVIAIEMPEEAFAEAATGKSKVQRIVKSGEYGKAIVTGRMRKKHKDYYEKIESILFPLGAKTKTQQKDVEIVANAWYYKAILITNDGDSKSQPDGILGKRAELAKLGFQVMRDSEAVELARERIKMRDEHAKDIAKETGKALPEWVGVD